VEGGEEEREGGVRMDGVRAYYERACIVSERVGVWCASVCRGCERGVCKYDVLHHTWV
jgi:hypothetical protein